MNLNTFLHSKRQRSIASALALTVIVGGSVATLTGCGGGSASPTNSLTNVATTRGRATLTIKWPVQTATRLIPVASNSIKISFVSGTSTVATQTVARPTSGNTSTVSFPSLPTGTLTLKADALPNTDGTGTAQASATQNVTINENATATLALTLGSTITSLTLTPAAPSLVVGSTTTVVATALDSSGATVLTSSSITFASSNTSVATVSSAGVVTGVAEGTATITATDSESGKTATVTATVTTSSTSTEIVDLANAYLATLSDAQKTATVVASSATNAAKWSNLPATPSGSTGTTNLRNGVSYSTLSTAQKTAWTALVKAVLTTSSSTQPYDQYNQIRASDAYLGTLQGGYSGDYQYIGFVGTPSTSGSWLLQIGGHHIAHNYYFNGSTPVTTTPYFIGVEPTNFTSNSTSYEPLSAQRESMYNLVNSLSASQLTSAKLSGSFSDVLLGAGQNSRSLFPTGTTGRGVLASSLTTAQKELVKTAIRAWTRDSTLASTYQSLYESELNQTYVAYSGTTTFENQGDYVRIDGPHVWIEFACQNGIVIQGQIHYHTIWRDRVSDYNAAYGF